MEQDSYIHLARPLAATAVQASQAPLNVVIHAQVLLSILDHAVRRNFEQGRVIGTLLGIRSEDGTEVEIRNCFAVGHNESQVQVEVDMDYHKAMYSLHLKANPKEILVGWYATSPDLNTFSALIQNFYASNGDGTYPHPAIHLTLSTVPGKDICCRTYISSPVGVTPDRAADSCLFLPVPYEIRYNEAEKSGLESLSMARNNELRQCNIITDIQSLENGLEEVLSLLERVAHYVSQVSNDDAPASFAIGQHLINTLSLAPNLEVLEVEKLFNTHLQDVLLVSYLANVVRTQIKIFSSINSIAKT